MAYPFRNPISPEQLNGTKSVSRSEVFGTNFSVLGIGGYMEVYNLSDLLFTIPSGSTGTIEYTGNSIPINFVKGTGSGYSPDVLVLGSDNLSSGRRRLGMLAYVYETDQIYQYRIDNYDTLWAAATGATGVGGDTVVISEFGTTIKNNSVAGQNFINAWTANTIEDVSGETSSTAVWKKLVTSGGGGSGGTTDFSAVSINNVTQFTSSSNKTINFSGINLTIISAATNTLVFSAGTGGGGPVSGDYLPLSGGTVTGGTIFTSGVTANTLSSIDYIDFDLLSGGTAASSVSRLRYVADEGGLVTTLLGGNIDLQIGQQNVVYCYNGDTVTLTKGQVVSVFGNQGNRPKIQRAIASAETTSSTALGVVSESIASGAEGFITTFGNVRGFQLTGITPGSYVYLSPTTLGDFTGTQPQAPNHIVAIGYVVRTGNTQGEIFVNINNGWELDELHNVRVTSPSQYDILQYSASSTPFWYNTSSPFFSGLTSTTISASTYQNLPSFNFVQITGTTQFSAGTNNYLNFSGINLTITSAATNTLVFSAGTGGGGGGGTTVTGGTYSAGTLTLDNSTGGTVSVTGFPATTSFGVTVDGSGGVITTGQKGYIRIPYGFTITSWTLIGSPSGSITFDIWRTNNAIPTVANTIIGGGGTKPSLSSATYATSSTLTNWTITGATGDVIGWNVDSCTTTTIATLQLFVTRTQ